MKIKVIANRDNGYEESYKFFKMVKDYFRLEEERGVNTEYYSDDDDANSLMDQVREEYTISDTTDLGNKTTPTDKHSDQDYEDLLNSI